MHALNLKTSSWGTYEQVIFIFSVEKTVPERTLLLCAWEDYIEDQN